MSKSMAWTLEPAAAGFSRRVRLALAAGLKWASVRMGRAALRVRGPVPVDGAVCGEPVLEFYAEAGAPEGALYVDGVRVGVVPGVARL